MENGDDDGDATESGSGDEEEEGEFQIPEDMKRIYC